MLLAVGAWTAASRSHALMTTCRLRARARRAGPGRGRHLPGGLRTAAETLPANLQGPRHRALVQRRHDRRGDDALLLGPLAIQHGWKRAFLATGALGVASGSCIWAVIARPPFLPRESSTDDQDGLAEPGRAPQSGALVASYALPAISPGPVLTILAIYLTQRLQVTAGRHQQRRPGFHRRRGASAISSGAGPRTATPRNNRRPIGMFGLLVALSLYARLRHA